MTKAWLPATLIASTRAVLQASKQGSHPPARRPRLLGGSRGCGPRLGALAGLCHLHQRHHLLLRRLRARRSAQHTPAACVTAYVPAENCAKDTTIGARMQCRSRYSCQGSCSLGLHGNRGLAAVGHQHIKVCAEAFLAPTESHSLCACARRSRRSARAPALACCFTGQAGNIRR